LQRVGLDTTPGDLEVLAGKDDASWLTEKELLLRFGEQVAAVFI
jgi:hypothetical protein